jgi:hypothetical protein
MPSVTPDLVPPDAPLVPVFPLADPIRPLTLYPGTAGEVRVRWRLRADEVVGHGTSFPSADGAPEAVLRLGRLYAEGGSEPIRERRLRLSGLSGRGEVGFQVSDDRSLLEAELGLMNPEGGWLLLARSNRLQPSRGLGLESLSRPPPGMDWGLITEPESDSRAVRLDRTDECLSPPPDGSTALSAESVDEASVEAGRSESTVPTVMNAIPRLTYADPTPATAALVIEAELRIHGWSTPNAVIDLFGHRYRVGPGGRFQLSVKVEDPELIRRALERHPPPESGDPR